VTGVVTGIMRAMESWDNAESSTIKSTHFSGGNTVEPLVTWYMTVVRYMRLILKVPLPILLGQNVWRNGRRRWKRGHPIIGVKLVAHTSILPLRIFHSTFSSSVAGRADPSYSITVVVGETSRTQVTPVFAYS
jgi:hypothetical protein